jgi:hypothetical protein
MVLGDVVAPEAGAIVGLDKLETIRELARELAAAVIHVVENAELHGVLPAGPVAGRMLFESNLAVSVIARASGRPITAQKQ